MNYYDLCLPGGCIRLSGCVVSMHVLVCTSVNINQDRLSIKNDYHLGGWVTLDICLFFIGEF
jgi:hypothetical protein